jgi:hypothetical protein
MTQPVQPQAAKPDPFFSIPAGSTWNACIGPQGDEENYVDGFIDAALALANLILEKEMFVARDTLVLPILYNARHGVELSLKFAMTRLLAAGILKVSHAVNHDIASHWQHLQQASIGDEAIRRHLSELQPYIMSLASIDDDGQQLRFATDVEGNPSLEDKPLANIQVIRNSLVVLQKVLRDLKNHLLRLCAENTLGSHTEECSRMDLMSIARMLPPRTEWSSASFTTAKQSVQERYKLSGKKFCTALDAIQANREMNAQLGVEAILTHLTDANARMLIDQWSTVHPVRQRADDKLGVDYFGKRDWEDTRLYSERKIAARNVILQTLSPAEIADANTIYYLGRDGNLPEQYDGLLAQEKNDHAEADGLRLSVDNLLSKTNLLKFLVIGLRRLGKTTLASTLESMRPDML